ncbi:acetate--CoA ligase family protein [Nesterenkonia natronophila]|nr:acetate--CoA ligase family protein [Nesterenkonia natronophila]
MGFGEDDLGHFLELQIGEWPLKERPSRLKDLPVKSDPGEWPLRGPTREFEDKMLALNKHRGASLVSLAAEADGGSTEWLTNAVARIESHGRQILIKGSAAHESAVGSNIVGDKLLTAELLEANGVATPSAAVVGSPEEAVEVAASIPGPVVVKPRNGNKSKGVSTGLTTDQEIRDAFHLAREHRAEVMVQQHIEIEAEMRVLASPDEAVAVNTRVFPHVTGDGVSTLRQLIEDKNLQRSLNPALAGSPIPIDGLTSRALERQGLDLESVPELAQTLTVREVGGLSVGADIEQTLEVTSEDLKATASKAIAAIPGLGWGGVDLIVEKGTGKPYVIEVNTNAGFASATFPTYGEPRDVGAHLWKLRLEAAPAQVSLVPEVPEQTVRPIPMLAHANGKAEIGDTSFGEVFIESLGRQNYSFQSKNAVIGVVTAPDGSRTWITKSGMTPADRFAVRHIIRRHEWVMQLLGDADVPRVRARAVRSPQQLRRFIDGRVTSAVLMPIQASWVGPDAHSLAAEEALGIESISEKLWVQARPPGWRVRILATPTGGWVVTTKDLQRSLNATLLRKATNAAVKAVRAIPELRWAAVDLVLRPKRVEANRVGGVLVEGLMQQPRYTTSDHVIAGDFDEFCRALITSGDSIQQRAEGPTVWALSNA